MVYPLTSACFDVYINKQGLSFQRISSVVQSVETEIITEGGLGHVHILPAPPKQVNTMTFIKGSGTFRNEAFPFQVGQYIETPIQIFVFEPNGARKLRKEYCVYGAFVTKWSLSDLNAESSDKLLETFEIQYERLEEIAVNL
ncbi:phage tail protein [Cellulosilyticum ruminicola]|uniref:phage tail protein n=1 Tax=Cellulosilyticum ruminicola TaxID=425254 RepID=UPI0006D10236|nr:phage tail protein [Cellulosilyticum ruminicola]